jgi:Fe-S cluster assembly protein SufD
MNVHSQMQLTPVESALIEGFRERFSDLPGSAETAMIRDEAIDLLKRSGLPHRRIEAWHYTDLRRLLSRLPEEGAQAPVPALAPILSDSAVFSVVGGRATQSADIAGLAAGRLSERLIAGDNSALSDELRRDDTIGQINQSMVTDGWVLSLGEDVHLGAPVEMQIQHGGGQVHSRCVLMAGRGSRATIVERLTGTGEALATHVDRLDLGEGAELTWIAVQEQPEDVTGFTRLEARLAEGAKLRLFVINAGGKLIRHELMVDVAGEGADFQLRGVNLLAGGSHTDVTMVLSHLGEGATSREIMRNVVTDRATGVFQGQIRVDRLAQKTDAKMACNTLLLSDTGEFSAKPELEIFADDVACGHGATVTEIDAGHLFYLMSRGITEREARGLLIKAFVAEIIEELDDETIVAALETRLERWFAIHG